MTAVLDNDLTAAPAAVTAASEALAAAPAFATRAQKAIAHIDAVLAEEAVPAHARPVWARLSQGSSVLLVANSDGDGECAGCTFVHDGAGSYVSDKLTEFLNHVRKHRNAGHTVPQGVEALIRADWCARRI